MPRTLCACSTDRCRCFTAFWRPLLGSGPRRQTPEGPARRCERGARPRPALLFLSTERDPRRFLATLAGLWGVWDALMSPKLSRTPRSLRTRQNQDPGGTRKDKKLPAPGLKEHSNPQVKGVLHKTTDMEKDTRYSVPTMFTSVMRLKQRSTEKAVCDSQSNVPGVNDEQILRVALQQVSGYPITQHVEENQSSKLMLGVVQGPSSGETRLSLKRRMVKCSGTIRPPNRPFRKVIRPAVL
ncbi:hypothetical protein NDU88_002246 [Pleurodeles waltl]|uniref:Uncharacterized protein n=1 Tax=Pleurodeles waltl TaxID=8319 RepID=A0AAV7TM18_PLEWA|nr:hypothetical protein NDU88_002246 [Pleurodeles waltl]